jgi:centrosomal CEP192-like protein
MELTPVPSGCTGPLAAGEDQVVSTQQSNATASMTFASGTWADMIAATFKAGSTTSGSPAVTLSPSSLTFGSQTVETTSPAQTVTLSNTGTATLSISRIAITGTNSGDFGESNNCGTSVAAGAQCTINVTFTPTAAGTRTATLSVSDNASASPQTVSLTGTGQTTVSAALVQVQNNIDTSGAAFTSFSVPITTQPGDLLVAFVRESSNGTDNFTVNDSAGQAWSLTASGYKNESSSGPRIGMFYMANSAAVTTVTVHFTTSGGVIKPGIMVMEISGAASTGVLDGSVNNASGASVTTSPSGSLTTTNANDILIFATDTAGNETGWTAGTGYAIPNNKLVIGASGSNVRMAMQYAVVSSVQSGTKTSMTYTNAAWNGNIFAAFK